ncbi:unnamed protein product [Rotaria socialis]
MARKTLGATWLTSKDVRQLLRIDFPATLSNFCQISTRLGVGYFYYFFYGFGGVYVYVGGVVYYFVYFVYVYVGGVVYYFVYVFGVFVYVYVGGVGYYFGVFGVFFDYFGVFFFDVFGDDDVDGDDGKEIENGLSYLVTEC